MAWWDFGIRARDDDGSMVASKGVSYPHSTFANLDNFIPIGSVALHNAAEIGVPYRQLLITTGGGTQIYAEMTLTSKDNVQLYNPSEMAGINRYNMKLVIRHGNADVWSSLSAGGFGFTTVAGVHKRIPQLGRVIIGNDVEIGANTCIDKGTIENTVIGEQTKIDNLVQIGHNCKIGKGCMIVSQVGIAGSCVIGDRVVIAGQVGMADHIEIGNDSILMAKAGVTRSFPEKSILIGAPAVPRKDFIKQLKTMKKAEELIDKFKKYEHLLKGLTDGND